MRVTSASCLSVNTKPDHAFQAHQLSGIVSQWPRPAGYRVALSGGADSTALLLALTQIADQLRAPLSAIHINHGLHRQADRWQTHCESLCATLSVPLHCRRVTVTDSRRRGPEAAAREARYRALGIALDANEMLLTAHHANDQAETLLLNLMRGAGVHGLAGMRACRPFAGGWLARPLLGWHRSALQNWLHEQQMEWIDDPSNENTQMRRNYLRHELIPALTAVWPAAVERLAASAALCGEAADLLDTGTAAAIDLLQSTGKLQLDADGLKELAPPQQSEIIHYWVRQNRLPVPSRAVILELVRQLGSERDDHQIRVAWPGAEIRHYRGRLYLLQPLPIAEPVSESEPTGEHCWSGRRQIELPNNLGRLEFTGQAADTLPDGDFRIAARRGGERLRLVSNGPHRPLKKLFQEHAIPPWYRPFVPLLWHRGRLLAVGDFWLSAELRQRLSGSDCKLHWQPALPAWQALRDHLLQKRL